MYTPTFTKLALFALASLLLLAFLPGSFAAAQGDVTFREAFPDEGFRANVLSRLFGAGPYRLSWYYDRVISDAEKETMATLTYLSLRNLSDYPRLTSLEGLEYFSSISYLYLHGDGQRLQDIDLSGNPNLTSLTTYDCIFDTIDLSNNPDLISIDLHESELKSLDVSNNLKLRTLIVHNNQLTELDISKNHDLGWLDVSYNNITKLDVSGNKKLYGIRANNNQLTNIEFPDSQILYHIEIHDNKLRNVDTSNLPNLSDLHAYNNQLTKVDLSNNSALRQVYIQNNRLEELAIANIPDFERLVCYNNQMGNDPNLSVPGWRQNPNWPEARSINTPLPNNITNYFIYFPQSPRSQTNPGTASPTTPENPGTASPTTPPNPTTPILQNLIDALPQKPSATDIQNVLTAFPNPAELIADPQNQAPLKYLETLYAQATGATLQPKIDKNTHGNFHKTESEVSALGALFNAPEGGGTLYLNFTAPAKNAQIDATLYKKNEAVQVDIKLLDSNGNELALKFPIAITIRIPSGINDENFVILHYKNGSQTPEVIRPKLNGDGTCTFIVNSFSVFVFTNALSDEPGGEGELGVERERERSEKPAPIVPVLYDIAKSGDTFSFKAIIANASGSMAGSKIYVTLNERYSAFATLGQDAVAIGTLDAPGFSGTIANFAARVVGVHAPAVTKPMVVTSDGNVVARN